MASSIGSQGWQDNRDNDHLPGWPSPCTSPKRSSGCTTLRRRRGAASHSPRPAVSSEANVSLAAGSCRPFSLGPALSTSQSPRAATYVLRTHLQRAPLAAVSSPARSHYCLVASLSISLSAHLPMYVLILLQAAHSPSRPNRLACVPYRHHHDITQRPLNFVARG